MRNKRFHRQSGMSLVELMVVAGIMGFVAVTASSLLFPFFHMAKQTRENISDTVDNDFTQRVWSAELKRAFIMRANGLTCGTDSDLILKTTVAETAGPPVFDFKPGASFSFFTAAFSSIGSRNINAHGELFVTDPNSYPKDSIVLAMDPGESDNLGFFKVVKSDLVNRKITLEPETLSGNPTPCGLASATLGLEPLFERSGGTTLMLHRVRVVTYRRDADHPKKVYRTLWPDEGSNPQGAMAIDRLVQMSIKGMWQAYGDAKSAGGERSGKWTGQISYKTEVPSLVKRDVGPKIREQVSKVAFDLGATKRVNRQARTTASDSAITNLKYPSCGVVMSSSPVSIAIDIPVGTPAAVNFANTKAFILEGTLSEDVAASLNTTFSTSADGFVSCYRLAEAQANQPITEMGMDGTIRMTREGTGFEKLICFAKGTVEVKASMEYFDTTRGRFVPVVCTGSAVSAPVGYYHSPHNVRASCAANDGTINFGDRVLSRATDEPGPTLFVGPESCIWETPDPLNPSDEGILSDWTNCDWTQHIGKRLFKVQILPEGLEISGYTDASKIIKCQ